MSDVFLRVKFQGLGRVVFRGDFAFDLELLETTGCDVFAGGVQRDRMRAHIDGSDIVEVRGGGRWQFVANVKVPAQYGQGGNGVPTPRANDATIDCMPYVMAVP